MGSNDADYDPRIIDFLYRRYGDQEEKPLYLADFKTKLQGLGLDRTEIDHSLAALKHDGLIRVDYVSNKLSVLYRHKHDGTHPGKKYRCRIGDEIVQAYRVVVSSDKGSLGPSTKKRRGGRPRPIGSASDRFNRWPPTCSD